MDTKDVDFYLFHFKTEFCPFLDDKIHNKKECVYSHNWLDYRRKPYKYQYSKDPCPQWSKAKVIQSYFDGCKNGKDCQKAHGWKEQEFHVHNYKFNKCDSGLDCNKTHCAYFHQDLEKREKVPKWYRILPYQRNDKSYHQQFYKNYTSKFTDSKSVLRFLGNTDENGSSESENLSDFEEEHKDLVPLFLKNLSSYDVTVDRKQSITPQIEHLQSLAYQKRLTDLKFNLNTPRDSLSTISQTQSQQNTQTNRGSIWQPTGQGLTLFSVGEFKIEDKDVSSDEGTS